MKKLLLVICLIATTLVFIQNKTDDPTQIKQEPVTVQIDFDDDNVPEFIFF